MRSILSVLSFIVVLSITTYSQKVDDYEMFQLKAMEGIDTFGVYVWEIQGYHKDSTLTDLDVEKYLRNAIKPLKVRIVSFSDSRDLPGQPNLEAQIRVDQKKNDDDYVYSVMLRFVQDVRMERNKQPHYAGIVWERDELGHAELADLNLEIKIALNSLVDIFISDFKEVN